MLKDPTIKELREQSPVVDDGQMPMMTVLVVVVVAVHSQLFLVLLQLILLAVCFLDNFVTLLRERKHNMNGEKFTGPEV